MTFSSSQGCYGVMDDETNLDDDSFTEGPLEPWFCEPCKAGLTMNPSCELCPNVGGIYKHTDNGKWVHLVCAIYTPNVGFRYVYASFSLSVLLNNFTNTANATKVVGRNLVLCYAV